MGALAESQVLEAPGAVYHELRQHGDHGRHAFGRRGVPCHGEAVVLGPAWGQWCGRQGGGAEVETRGILHTVVLDSPFPSNPLQVHSVDEVESFASISSAVLINMGTLSSEWVASKKLAANKARALGRPWVLDPVGCGATPYRTRACLDMLYCRPAVVRGNGSEILALSGAEGQPGVWGLVCSGAEVWPALPIINLCDTI